MNDLLFYMITQQDEFFSSISTFPTNSIFIARKWFDKVYCDFTILFRIDTRHLQFQVFRIKRLPVYQFLRSKRYFQALCDKVPQLKM